MTQNRFLKENRLLQKNTKTNNETDMTLDDLCLFHYGTIM